MQYAEVYLDIKTLEINRPFDYILPAEFEADVTVGSIVIVPFGKIQKTGFVTRIKGSTSLGKKELRSIDDVVGKLPVFDRDMLKLIHWMSRYYLQPFGRIVEFFLPPGKKDKILKAFREPEKYLEYEIQEKYDLDIHTSGPVRKTTENVPENKSKEHKDCIASMSRHITKKTFKSFLLHDFKYEDRISIYRGLINTANHNKKTALIITPEIINTEKIFNDLTETENEKINILYHSGISQSKRFAAWFKVYSGDVDLLAGNRSAIFLPFKKLGIIIIEDEHDPSYKESTLVRYNVREVVLRLGKILKIPVLFSSYTPSLEFMFLSENNDDYCIIRPGNGFWDSTVIKKEVQDLKKIDRFKEDIHITNSTYRLIRSRKEKKEKILLFLNKRGFSSFIICRKCGNIPKCPSCNTSYSFHNDTGKMTCSHCTHQEQFKEECPKCGSKEISFRGTGIEKIEKKLLKRFEDLPIVRVDSDTVKNITSFKEMFSNYSSNESLLILGTEKILKDITINKLTAACVIEYDSLFQFPDFHINERVFQMLVSILSILENKKDSVMLIQAYNTDDSVLNDFVRGDYYQFYKKELEIRKELSYPPFLKLINIIVTGKNELKVKKDIMKIALEIGKIKKIKISVLGPAPAPISRINLFYRWHILVKTGSVLRFNISLNRILKELKKDEENKLILDVDPVWIL